MHLENNNIFKYGKEAYAKAIEQAISCGIFVLDKDEDECVTSIETNSCYNCLYRRWTKDSFMCMKISK